MAELEKLLLDALRALDKGKPDQARFVVQAHMARPVKVRLFDELPTAR